MLDWLKQAEEEGGIIGDDTPVVVPEPSDNLVESPDYNYDGNTLPAVSASASRGEDGKIHISMVNIDQ